jgi:hypothetical protein
VGRGKTLPPGRHPVVAYALHCDCRCAQGLPLAQARTQPCARERAVARAYNVRLALLAALAADWDPVHSRLCRATPGAPAAFGHCVTRHARLPGRFVARQDLALSRAPLYLVRRIPAGGAVRLAARRSGLDAGSGRGTVLHRNQCNKKGPGP